MRRLLLAACVSALTVFAFASAAMADEAGGVTGPAFYVDGQLYRTRQYAHRSLEHGRSGLELRHDLPVLRSAGERRDGRTG